MEKSEIGITALLMQHFKSFNYQPEQHEIQRAVQSIYEHLQDEDSLIIILINFMFPPSDLWRRNELKREEKAQKDVEKRGDKTPQRSWV
jgi:hypothetical protein